MDSRERELVRLLWREGRLSRWELHERSGQTPNGVGLVAGRLLKQGLLRECASEPSSGGRPRVPLELDPTTRHVVGLMITPGTIEAGRLNLYGKLLGEPERRETTEPTKIVEMAAELLRGTVSPETLGIGVSVTGIVDPANHAILQSSAIPGEQRVSLEPLYQAAGTNPLLLANDVQALAARWMLTHGADVQEDVLVVSFGDGHMGAAMLLEGRPNRGCVMACNELGHMRMPIDTERCYCGQVGCLERIFSTPFLSPADSSKSHSLRNSLETEADTDTVKRLITLLAMGIGNCVNFMRPHRLVLVSTLLSAGTLEKNLVDQIRGALLREIATRVTIERWDPPAFESAETAGWAALVNLYANAWQNMPRPITQA